MAQLWSTLQLIAWHDATIHVRTKEHAPGGPRVMVGEEIKCPPGTSPEVRRLVATMDVSADFYPVLGDLECQLRDLHITTLAEIHYDVEGYSITYGLAIESCAEHKIPLKGTPCGPAMTGNRYLSIKDRDGDSMSNSERASALRDPYFFNR